MRQKFTALNGLRILAALAVINFHYGQRLRRFDSWPQFWQNLAGNGAIALPFFYVLSGFVLAHAYNGKTFAGRSEIRTFYGARLGRLFPAYMLAWLIFLPMAVAKYLWHPAAPAGHDAHTFLWAGGLTLFAVQAWTPFSQAWNGPAWSVSVELFFYVLFPFVLPAINRMRSARLTMLVTAVWLMMISLTLGHEFNLIHATAWSRYFMYQPLFWLPTFLMGVATYRCAERWRCAPDGFATFLSVATLSLLVLLTGWLRPERGDFLVNGGAAPLIAVIVLAFSHPRAFSSRLMGTPVLSYLGGISYAIYILQNPVWHMWEVLSTRIWHGGGVGTLNVWRFAAYLVVLTAFAAAVQATLETPLQRWLRQRRGAVETGVAQTTNAPVAA